MIRFRAASAMLVGLVAIVAGTAPLGAQSTAPATTNGVEIAPPPPASGNVVGPRELQDFSLGGRPARQAEPTPPAVTAPAPAQQTAGQTAPVPTRPATTSPTSRQADAAPSRSTATQTSTPPAPNIIDSLEISPPISSAAPVETGAPVMPDVAAVQDDGSPGWWPWLLAGLALVAAAAFFAWRKLQPGAGQNGYDRLAYAGAEPAPVPQPRPAPPAPQRRDRWKVRSTPECHDRLRPRPRRRPPRDQPMARLPPARRAASIRNWTARSSRVR
ncbi:hypothetical protein H9L12_09370 [Sphingomonas rhizophila]|uniref:Uncharacterized protein n=1 Tax=Sphingomonas rhizophila TaxID=2071607 RepID=A0A7G9S9J3_9SPHN|nr:hypothetical protein [Sphingomonas rhizophila]QNN64518.1 hypothetical protein H9L12_09370 [Sphingomonas rhizophila]